MCVCVCVCRFFMGVFVLLAYSILNTSHLFSLLTISRLVLEPPPPVYMLYKKNIKVSSRSSGLIDPCYHSGLFLCPSSRCVSLACSKPVCHIRYPVARVINCNALIRSSELTIPTGRGIPTGQLKILNRNESLVREQDGQWSLMYISLYGNLLNSHFKYTL